MQTIAAQNISTRAINVDTKASRSPGKTGEPAGASGAVDVEFWVWTGVSIANMHAQPSNEHNGLDEVRMR